MVPGRIRKEVLYEKEYDPVTFDILKVKAEELSEQITLTDLIIFKAVSFEELQTRSWMKKNKRIEAPNVLRFTDRFNSVCLWSQREILSHETMLKRAGVIAHFIKIAKLVGKQDFGTYLKIRRLFGNDRNWELLRKHMETLKLPCIPYLGLFLTDLSFIEVAHQKDANRDFNEKRKKEDQTNNILRQIAHFQESFYDISFNDHLQKYLQSFQHHDELLKFAEEDLYRQSLLCEPEEQPASPDIKTATFRRRSSYPRTPIAALRMRSRSPTSDHFKGSFTPQLLKPRRLDDQNVNRRARNLGADLLLSIENLSLESESCSTSLATGVANDSAENTACFTGCVLERNAGEKLASRLFSFSSPLSPLFTPKTFKKRTRSVRSLEKSSYLCIPTRCGSSEKIGYTKENALPDHEGEAFLFVVRNRGSKPVKLHCSRRCYLELRSGQLHQFFSRRMGSGSKNIRSRYRKKASKKMRFSVDGWRVMRGAVDSDVSFEVHHPPTGRIYRYLCKDQATADEWYKNLQAAVALPRTPSNLILFE